MPPAPPGKLTKVEEAGKSLPEIAHLNLKRKR